MGHLCRQGVQDKLIHALSSYAGSGWTFAACTYRNLIDSENCEYLVDQVEKSLLVFKRNC